MADEHDKPMDETPAAEQVAAPPTAPAPGATLRDARNKKSLSLDELVVQTKLPLSVLQAMEADDFRTLSEPVYVRGYYRKYARVLGLDEAPIIAGYEAHGGSVTRKPEVSLLVPEDPRPSARWPLFVGLVVLIAVIAAGVNWYFSRDESASATTAQPAVANNPGVARPQGQAGTGSQVRPPATVRSVPAQSRAPQAQDEDVAEDVAAADDAIAGGSDDSAPANTPDETAQPDRAPAREQQRPAESSASNSLVLDFADDSWVRVEDDTGQRLLNGLVKAGQTRQLAGVAPYTVFLGYAPGVTVRYQGDDVAVSPHTRGNNTARFTVE